jgi:tetratricopeptide (TPR) repeat protein
MAHMALQGGSMRFTSLVFAALLSTGCSGIGVVATTDPLTKLNDAEDLLFRQDRPLIAERLIREAMTIYQEQGNFHGLGNAHRGYADLIMSPTVSGKWEKFYRDKGFQDKTVTYDNRAVKAAEYYAKAIEYYGRATDEVRKDNRYDLLTNVYFNMAYSYNRLDDRINACRFYDETLEAYNENIRRNPGVKPYSSTGTVPDLVAAKKKQVGCV